MVIIFLGFLLGRAAFYPADKAAPVDRKRQALSLTVKIGLISKASFYWYRNGPHKPFMLS